MKILYLECNMGAAGDMLMAALLELIPDPDAFLTNLNGLGIPGVRVEREPAVKCGITGTHIAVRVDGKSEGEEHAHEHAHEHPHSSGHLHSHSDSEHAHTHSEHTHTHEHAGAHTHSHSHSHEAASMADIRGILQSLSIPAHIKDHALAVYQLIAEAESKAHGKPVDMVHFHEVGMMDAIADIIGVCLLIDILAPARILASPIHVGSGHVYCAHGVLPVPAPATAHILKGVPTYGGQIAGELCTPTGAALLKHFVHAFGDRPVMAAHGIGYGMGKKDFPAANCLRAFWGESGEECGDVVELACNLDDMTGEELGFALETLLENGALDAWIVPIQMKKSRPAQTILCLCKPEDEEKMAALLFKHTTTFGVRANRLRRYTLDRSTRMADTAYGRVSIKTGEGFGVCKSKIEYEDLAALARANGVSIAEVRKKLR